MQPLFLLDKLITYCIHIIGRNSWKEIVIDPDISIIPPGTTPRVDGFICFFRIIITNQDQGMGT